MIRRTLAALMLLLAIAGVVLAQPYRHQKIVFAEAVFVLQDLTAKDVFIFHAPLPPRLSGVVVGVKVDGAEYRVVPTPSPSLARPQTVPKLASLTPACASCHTASLKVRGGFVLFNKDGSINKEVAWKEVLDAIEPTGKTPARMPPATAGKPAVSVEDLEEIRRLARAQK